MSALVAAAHSMPASGNALLVTAVPTFLAPLFLPRSVESRRALLIGVLGWALAVLLLASLSWVALGVPPAPARLALASLVALGILVVAHQTASLLRAVLRAGAVADALASECSVWVVTALLWLSASTPLWLGPVADLGARVDPTAPTLILACSPLAHLAAAAGHDLLRGEWFYAHSTLGSLQVEYPRVETLLVGYALVAAALTLLLASVRRRPNGTAAGIPPITPLERYS